MRRFFYPIGGIVLFVLALSLISCQTAVNRSTGEGRYSLKRSTTMPNHWEVLVNGNVENVYKAVLKGIKDLGLRTYENRADSLSAVVTGSFADTTEYTIRLSYEAQDVTRMLIRVGYTGDKDRTVEIFKAVEKYL